MQFRVCFIRLMAFVLFGGFSYARAVEFSGRVVDLLNQQPIANAAVTITPREIVGDDLLPLSESANTVTARTDTNGRFTVDVPKAFIAVSIAHAGFADYLNVLIKVDPKKPLTIELVTREPSAAESEIIERRRVEAQIIEHFRQEQEILNEPPADRAAAGAQPVVPTMVRVQDLNGYTGNVNLDEFIAGVVTREMNDGFPYEALKAQAVAARTYALARLRDRGYANGGQAYSSTLSPKSSAAAFNSSGVALTHSFSYISAFFSARCNGDFTLASEDGLSGLATCTVGGLVGGRVIPYLRERRCSGHVNCSATTEQCCAVTVDGRQQYIYGHGVGLCQRGAQQFAGRDGMDWQEIVDAYYTNVTTLEGHRLRLGDRVEMITAATRRSSPCGTAVGSTAAVGATGTVIAGPQTVACNLISGTSYITWWRLGFDSGTRAWVAEDFFKKAPGIQPLPDLRLSVTNTSAAAIITARGLASARVVLRQSSNLVHWTPVATNTIATDGTTTFMRSVPGYYAAVLLIPDTAP